MTKITGFNKVKLKDLCIINDKNLSEDTDKDYIFEYIDISSVQSGMILGSQTLKFLNSPSRARRIVENENILFSTVRPTLQAIAMYKKDYYSIASTGFAVLKAKKYVDIRYVYQALFSRYVLNQIKGALTGSSYPAINNNDIKNLEILNPSFKEQNKIADILSTWDHAINLKKEKLDLNIQFRTNTGLKLIHNQAEKSKNNNVNYNKLKRLLIRQTARVGNLNIEPVSVGVHGIRKRSEIYDKRLSDDYSNNKLLRKNNLCFGLGTNNIVYGVLFEEATYCVSPAYSVFEIIKADPYYLREYLDTYNAYLSNKYMIISARQGKSIDMKGLLNEKIYLPEFKKQERIVRYLKSIDNHIKLLKDEINQLENQKKGLMQRLLTGKIRVQV